MRFVHASRFATSVGALFGFHERPDALQRLTPPWERSRVIVPPSSLAVGTMVVVESFVGPVPVRLEAEHVAYEHGVEFADRLRRGPFRSWLHRHRFFADGDGSILVDDIAYTLPLDPFSRPADALLVRPRLLAMFRYRHEETARALGIGAPEPIDRGRLPID